MVRVRTNVVALGLLLGTILAGCGDSGGGDKNTGDPALTDEEAKAVAMQSLAKVINTVATAAESVESTVVTSRSMNVVAKTGIVDIPVAEPLKQKILTQTQQAYAGAKQRVTNARARSIAKREGGVDADELATYLVLQSREGNVLTYTLNPDTLCESGDTTCLDNLERITIVQTMQTDDSGTLDLRVDDSIFLTIGYAANSIYLQIDLAELKAIAESEGTAEFDDVSAFEGQLRLTLTVLNETAGAEKVSIGFGIPKAVKIAGKQDGQDVGLDVAASDTVLALTADAGADTATVELGLGTTHLLYLDGVTPNIFHLGGLTGTFTFSADALVATGVGIGGEAYFDDGANGTKDDRVTMSGLDFTSDGETQLITLNSALNVSQESLSPTSKLATTAATGTALEWFEIYPSVGDTYDVWKVVDGGPFTMAGTGALAGALIVTEGSCFRENPVSGVFPIVAAGCP